jgi:hypothetical protein
MTLASFDRELNSELNRPPLINERKSREEKKDFDASDIKILRCVSCTIIHHHVGLCRNGLFQDAFLIK